MSHTSLGRASTLDGEADGWRPGKQPYLPHRCGEGCAEDRRLSLGSQFRQENVPAASPAALFSCRGSLQGLLSSGRDLGQLLTGKSFTWQNTHTHNVGAHSLHPDMLSTHMLCVHTPSAHGHTRAGTHTTHPLPRSLESTPLGRRVTLPEALNQPRSQGGPHPHSASPVAGWGGGGGEEPNTNSLPPLRKTLVWGGRGEEGQVSFNCHPLPSILSWTLASLSEPINPLPPTSSATGV